MSGSNQAVFQNQRSFFVPAAPGQQAYTNAGTYSWVAPAGVSKVSVVAVGGGAGGGYSRGGGGGGLGYSNNVTVVPGNSYSVVVGGGGTPTNTSSGGTGGTSYFVSTSIVSGGGGSIPGSNQGGTYTGTGGGNGGSDVTHGISGGGGAGGYSGAGGNPGYGYSTAPTAGSGGGGAGGGSAFINNRSGGGGGGVGILGQGSNGVPLNNGPTVLHMVQRVVVEEEVQEEPMEQLQLLHLVRPERGVRMAVVVVLAAIHRPTLSIIQGVLALKVQSVLSGPVPIDHSRQHELQTSNIQWNSTYGLKMAFLLSIPSSGITSEKRLLG